MSKLSIGTLRLKTAVVLLAALLWTQGCDSTLEVDLRAEEAEGLTKEIIRQDDDGSLTVLYAQDYLEETAGACTPGNTMRIWWDDINVCRTPSDPGSFEEWKSRMAAGTTFAFIGENTLMKRQHSPPDNLNLPLDDPFRTCWNHQIDKIRYLNAIQPGTTYVYANHYGYESDSWPGGSDPLPDYTDIVPFANCAGNFVWVNECGWDNAYRRYACTAVQFYVY